MFAYEKLEETDPFDDGVGPGFGNQVPGISLPQIDQVSNIARQMVGRWGMSPAIGTITVLPQDGRGPLLPGVTGQEPQFRLVTLVGPYVKNAQVWYCPTVGPDAGWEAEGS